jgi:prepilin-type N-terminal cleavage/methylation domain-containing protein
MHQYKEKKTVIKANLRHRIGRSYRRCGQKCRYNLQARKGGFTLIEILLVVVIIAIAAMVAVPMIGSTSGMQIQSAANIIAADLEYTKSMAISRQKNYSLVFNLAGDYYEVHDSNGIIIKNPVTKLDYKVYFRSDSRLNKVVIESATLDPSSDPPTITFDYLGSPYSGSGTSNPLNSGVVNIKAGDFTMNIIVEPVTGFISITE